MYLIKSYAKPNKMNAQFSFCYVLTTKCFVFHLKIAFEICNLFRETFLKAFQKHFENIFLACFDAMFVDYVIFVSVMK